MASELDPTTEGISKLRDMLLGRRSQRLSKLHVLSLHPEDDSTEGDLDAEKKLGDTANDADDLGSEEGNDEAPAAKPEDHPLYKDVMAKLHKLVPPKKK